MESLLKPMKLSPDFNRVLEEIRDGAENALYGAVPAAYEELFKRNVESLIEGAGLPSLQVIHYRWYLREIARLWRTRRDRDLAFHLELCIRKWVGLGLEPRTLQFLICEAHQRLKGTVPDCGAPSAGDCPQSPVDVRSLETAKDAKIAKAGSDSTAGTEQSVESVKSVDVRSGPGPDTGILESSTHGTLQ